MRPEEEFLEDCYNRYYSFLLNLCRREVSNNLLYVDIIDTCIQDTFLVAYQSYAQIKGYANIRAWLARTCLNRLLPYVKLQRSRQDHEAFSLDDDRIFIANSNALKTHIPECETTSDAIQKIFVSLSPKEKMVFHYYFITGYSADETASLAHCNPATIRVFIFRIRKRQKNYSECKQSRLLIYYIE